MKAKTMLKVKLVDTACEALLSNIEIALLAVDRVRFLDLIEQALSVNMTPSDISDQLILPILEKMGAGWEAGSVSLSQVFMAGRLVEDAAEELLSTPKNSSSADSKIAVVLLDDYHMLGKQMVMTSLRLTGFDICDYGRMKVEELVQRIKEDSIKLLLISTLMLRSALLVKEVRRALTEAGLKVTIFVGGAPFRFDQNLWREVGADAFGNNAADAIRLVRDFTATAKGT